MDRLTIPEYEVMIEAFKLELVDRDYYMHWQAYLNFAAQAEKNVGKGRSKPVYDQFEKFFDYKKEISRASKLEGTEKKERFTGIGKLLKKGG